MFDVRSHRPAQYTPASVAAAYCSHRRNPTMIRSQICTRLLPTLGLLAFAAASPAAQPESVQVFAAGSLRGVVTDLAAEAGPTLGVAVQPSFGGSGAMR